MRRRLALTLAAIVLSTGIFTSCGGDAPPEPTPEQNMALGERRAAEWGWTGGEWECLWQLWWEESGWQHRADNPTSDAYGIPQALPGWKMGEGWQDDPAVQIEWGLGYIAGRYGHPCGALGAKRSRGWY